MAKKIEDDKDEPGRAKVLKDNARLRVPMWAMDAKSIQDANAVYGHRPGYRFSQKLMRDGDTAREAIIDSYENYDREISENWRTTDAKEGDSCVAPNGTAGVLRFASGKLVCVPQSAARTSDTSNFVVNDDADLRELAYRLYDNDISNRWRSED